MATILRTIGPEPCAMAHASSLMTFFDQRSPSITTLSGSVHKVMCRAVAMLGLKLLGLAGLALLAVDLGYAQPAENPDTYTSEYEKSGHLNFYQQEKYRQAANIQQEQFRTHVSIEDALSDDVPLAFPKTAEADIKADIAKPKSTVAETITLPFAAIVIFGAIVLQVKRRLDSSKAAHDEALFLSQIPSREDAELARYLDGLQKELSSPVVVGAASPSNTVESAISENIPVVETDTLQEFLISAPDHLANLRQLFFDLSGLTDNAARRTLLLEFSHHISRFKDTARSPELRPVWLMAFSLEGLFRQLSSNAANVTASVIQTAASAVDLLEALSVGGVDPNLATEPPVRILAVDDDPISRLALSFALKKRSTHPR